MPELDGKTAIVTGAGQGIGAGEALALALEGARVVVNDVSREHAELVRERIVAAGGSAEVNTDDIADWNGAQNLVHQALTSTGRLDVLVCNAGNLRDRMLYNLDADDWDAVDRVHLRGHFAPIRHASAHWRAQAKETGLAQNARIITTTSEAGLFGHEGQANYSAAKAGIIGLTLVAARELERFGVTVNSISPRGRTQMTVGAFGDAVDAEGGQFDEWDPENVGPWVAFLASDAAAHITGQVFVTFGGTVELMTGWSCVARINQQEKWTMQELQKRAAELIPDLRLGLDPFPVNPGGVLVKGSK